MIRKPLKQTANSAFKHLRLLQHNDKTMTGRCQYSDVKSKKVWMDAQFEMPRTGRLNNSGRKKNSSTPGRWSCCNPSIFMVSLFAGKALSAQWTASLLECHIRKHDRRSLGCLGRSFFLSLFFRIVFCPRFVPKDVPRNHPRHIDDADDDCSQKVQCGKNNI